MRREKFAFTDVGNGKPVSIYRDKLGRRWLAQSAWFGIRARVNREEDEEELTMRTIEAVVRGIPAMIRVTHWEPYDPGRSYGPPEDCYPPSGGYGEWIVCDRQGRPAPWLERRMSEEDREQIEALVFECMEEERE